MICGNPEVIELLEAYLALARKHPFGSVAIAMAGHPNIGAADFAGDIALELSTQEALGVLAKRLDASIDNWSPPARDEALDASHVCYNVANGPLGFDFLVWLVDAEMTRVRERAPGPLKVGFWLGRDGRLTPDREMWLNRVFRPALKLLGAVEDSRACAGRHKELYVSRDIVAAAQAGEAVPQFKSVAGGLHGAVTITLREAEHWPSRNSNLGAWIKFAEFLRSCGERVIFVRDTAKAGKPVGQFEICPQASVDLACRMSLYQGAKANLFVSNGPATLALFSNRPWLVFVNVGDYAANTAKFWAESMGVPVGEQYPWSTPGQRIVWTPDTYKNIMSAWESLGGSNANPSMSMVPEPVRRAAAKRVHRDFPAALNAAYPGLSAGNGDL